VLEYWEDEQSTSVRVGDHKKNAIVLVGGSCGRGSANPVDLQQMADGRWVDSRGKIWFFNKFDGADQLSNPRGVHYDVCDEVVYVADAGNCRIQRFRLGNPIGETVVDRNEGSLVYPAALVVAPDGALFVSDADADRVLRFPPIFD